MRNDVISSKVKIGICVEGPDGRPRGSVKAAGDTLVGDLTDPTATPTSTEEKIDILLQEIGFAVLGRTSTMPLTTFRKRDWGGALSLPT
jgi:hypothetical protein